VAQGSVRLAQSSVRLGYGGTMELRGEGRLYREIFPPPKCRAEGVRDDTQLVWRGAVTGTRSSDHVEERQ